MNEVLSHPKWTDWDRDGKANARDEWIELYNAGDTTIDLSGWSLVVDETPLDADDTRLDLRKRLLDKAKGALRISGWLAAARKDDDRTYVFPEDMVLEPGAYLVLYQGKTGLDLEDKGFQLLLRDAGDTLVDRVVVGELEVDTGYGRTEGGTWVILPLPSPGEANVLPAE